MRISYPTWHFYEALKGILEVFRNFRIFLWHYFSVGLLLRTLFKPWHRNVSVKTSAGFDFKEALARFVFDFFSRIIGFFVRIFTILLALILEFLLILSGILVFIFWITLPILLLISFYAAFNIFIT